MLISVHMPKTAGTSFTESLRGLFGDGLQLAYEDRPLHRSASQRNRQATFRAFRNAALGLENPGADCVHGHFLPLAYRWARTDKPLRFVTWLRDPVERLVSHYEHWRREEPPVDSDSLHQQMLTEDWSLEDFAFRPELQNVYSTFLWGFPRERFDFIGITEHYDDELAYLGREILGAPLETARERQNPDRTGGSYNIEPGLRQRIEAFHDRDMKLNHYALNRRAERLGQK